MHGPCNRAHRQTTVLSFNRTVRNARVGVLRAINRGFTWNPTFGAGVFRGRLCFPKKKSQPGAYTVYAPGCAIFMENGVDLEKPHPQT